jgi:multidrug efflux system outer membrane protein
MSGSRSRRQTVTPLCLSLALAGCTVGPAYHPPQVAMPAHFSPTAMNDAGDLAHWWHGWNDVELDRLVVRGLAQNLDLAQAAARVREARWQVTIAGATGKPQLSAEGSASRTRLSRNSSIGSIASGPAGLAGAGLPGSDFSSFRTGFDAAWEIDLFGGTRRAVEAAAARAEAAEWNRRDAQLVLIAEIADSYLQYRAVQARIAIADADLTAARDLHDVIAARTGAGLGNTLDLRRQEQVVAGASASRATLDAERDVLLHALALLLGGAPDLLSHELADGPLAATAPPAIGPGLPSELLKRRPDIRAAERRLAAASADIGVATADRLPRLNLTGAADLVSTALARLISGDSAQLSLAAGVTAPLLDGGRGRATVRLREEAYREAELGWRGTVHAALRDVADALSRQNADRGRLAALGAADAAARDALDTSRVRYRAGLTPFLDVLTARASSLAASDALAQARAARDRDMVALFKALGGGWQEDAMEKAS